MTTSAQRTDSAAPNGAAQQTDQIFAQPRPRVDDFVFDGKTAGVFDDMLGRSVPFYAEIQRMTTELAADFAAPGSNLYDLGCSTGTTLAALDPLVHPTVRFVGIDDSPEMLDKAQQKLGAAVSGGRAIDLVSTDLHELNQLENASVVLLTLTLQFVRPLHRERLIRAICAGTNQQGCLILVEKLTESDTLFNRLFIKYYYDMKRRNGYSDLEIAQKREALENVLIPYRAEENEQLLLAGGYSKVQRFFQWYNFAGVIAVK
ncbi:MAG: carboxy-S-adenosyl-L-methionine synthase CmoA [Gemmatimonadaceae bacterium]